MNILIAILVIGLIVFLHELGHFSTAKLFKMPVSDFSIGMGPEVISFTKNDTTYALRAFPIGGHVNIEGMELDSNIENGFNSKPAWQRFIVLIAGIMMNFLTAIVFLFVLFKVDGTYEIDKRAIIGEVTVNSPSYNILQKGDVITEINGKHINEWTDIATALQQKFENDNVEISFIRNNVEEKAKAKVIYDEKLERSLLGIQATTIHRDLSVGESMQKAGSAFVQIFKDMFAGFSMLIHGKVSKDEIAGPIGVIQIIGESTKYGLTTLGYMIALLSINIGFLNLVPIPALDGGRIIFVILEMLGINISKKIEENIHRVGIVLLFSLIFFVSINDIMKFFR